MTKSRLNNREQESRLEELHARSDVLIGIFLVGIMLFLVGLNRMSAWYHIVFATPLIMTSVWYALEYWKGKGHEINDNHSTRK